MREVMSTNKPEHVGDLIHIHEAAQTNRVAAGPLNRIVFLYFYVTSRSGGENQREPQHKWETACKSQLKEPNLAINNFFKGS